MQPDIFIVGVPKAGTTWLASTLSQHPTIQLSNPKEPNIITSHKGTFERVIEEINWSKYENLFEGPGIRIDASVHTFACPESPKIISEKIPNAKFILCIREPISRTVSHWNMVRDTKSDIENNTDWSNFSIAWKDDRLREDSMYGKSMKLWLKYFSLDNFLIIDTKYMKLQSNKVLSDVESFLGLMPHVYDTDLSKHANRATDRRKLTYIGIIFKKIISKTPKIVKAPIVKKLQSRDINIYSSPLISKKINLQQISKEHYSLCSHSILPDLELFEKLTGFSTEHWKKEIKQQILHE
tara:strand:- start:273 stop:1160 length:888 start_codon:yes stop_codon:yes gene_type:complete